MAVTLIFADHQTVDYCTVRTTPARHKARSGPRPYFSLRVPLQYMLFAAAYPSITLPYSDMKALIQRVSQASVTVDGHTHGRIGQGLLVLICAEADDTEAKADRLLNKLLKLRIFSDDAGKMNRSVQDVEGGLLIVSQFTLAADVWSGNRPGFSGAADPQKGEKLYDYFVAAARTQHPVVETGVFG